MKKIIFLLLLFTGIYAQNTTDLVNCTTTTLDSAGVFTGSQTLMPRGYASILVQVYSDKSSATNGVEIQWSNDKTNYDKRVFWSYNAEDTTTNFTCPVMGLRYRIKYTNGTDSQTVFRLNTVWVPQYIPTVDKAGIILTDLTGTSLDHLADIESNISTFQDTLLERVNDIGDSARITQNSILTQATAILTDIGTLTDTLMSKLSDTIRTIITNNVELAMSQALIDSLQKVDVTKAQLELSQRDTVGAVQDTLALNSTFSRWATGYIRASGNDTLEVSKLAVFTNYAIILPGETLEYSIPLDISTFPKLYIKRYGTVGTPYYDCYFTGL